MTPQETALLKMVGRRQGTGDPAVPIMPIAPRIQNLIDQGYIKTSPLYEAVLGRPTGDVGLSLTDKGRAELEK